MKRHQLMIQLKLAPVKFDQACQAAGIPATEGFEYTNEHIAQLEEWLTNPKPSKPAQKPVKAQLATRAGKRNQVVKTRQEQGANDAVAINMAYMTSFSQADAAMQDEFWRRMVEHESAQAVEIEAFEDIDPSDARGLVGSFFGDTPLLSSSN